MGMIDAPRSGGTRSCPEACERQVPTSDVRVEETRLSMAGRMSRKSMPLRTIDRGEVTDYPDSITGAVLSKHHEPQLGTNRCRVG
jgi:hypothetical protein